MLLYLRLTLINDKISEFGMRISNDEMISLHSLLLKNLINKYFSQINYII